MQNEDQVRAGQKQETEATSATTLDEIERNESSAGTGEKATGAAAPSPDGQFDTPRESAKDEAGPI